MELLSVIGDLDLPNALPTRIGHAALDALEREIGTTRGQKSRPRRRRRFARRALLIPVALVLTTAAAIAGVGVITGFFPNPSVSAKKNVADTPLQLFKADLPAQPPASPRSLWHETVIPSSVHTIATPIIAGIGKVQYWVANTTQHGICTAIRLPGGSWAGLKSFDQLSNSLVGCRPTRAQLGTGTLILSGFDYISSEVLTRGGEELALDYGEITAPGHASKIRDESSGVTAPVIDGRYFLLVTPAAKHGVGNMGILDLHLVALNSSGKIIADEKKPLPGAPGHEATPSAG